MTRTLTQQMYMGLDLATAVFTDDLETRGA